MGGCFQSSISNVYELVLPLSGFLIALSASRCPISSHQCLQMLSETLKSEAVYRSFFRRKKHFSAFKNWLLSIFYTYLTYLHISKHLPTQCLCAEEQTDTSPSISQVCISKDSGQNDSLVWLVKNKNIHKKLKINLILS